jgi:hypothetical protein
MASRDTPDPSINWATAAITPHPDWIRLSQKKFRPDFLELSNEAIATSGREANGYLVYEVVAAIYRLFHHYVLGTLDRNPAMFPNAVQDCQLIIQRNDYTDAMIWNYLTHWGPEGDAIYRLTAEYLSEGDSMSALVQAIQSGQWDRKG